MINSNAYAWFVRGATHAAMCRSSVESVKKADPGARCIVVTDEPEFEWDAPSALILHIDSGMPIMLANLEAQLSALAAAWHDGYERLTLLDTDTLLVKPVHDVGDITFTWRDSIGVDEDGEKVEGIAARMPYNYGVIVVRPGIRSFEAFIWLRERIRAMHAQNQEWYGNQLAAAELAGPRPTAGMSIDERSIPWRIAAAGKTLRIGKVPCEQFNYTPQSADEDITARAVLHFKGARRALMRLYAARLGVNWYADEHAAA